MSEHIPELSDVVSAFPQHEATEALLSFRAEVSFNPGVVVAHPADPVLVSLANSVVFNNGFPVEVERVISLSFHSHELHGSIQVEQPTLHETLIVNRGHVLDEVEFHRRGVGCPTEFKFKSLVLLSA